MRYRKPLLYACVCHTLQLRTSLSVEHFKVFVTWRLPLGRCGHSSSVIHSWLCFFIPRGTTLDTDKFYCSIGWVRAHLWFAALPPLIKVCELSGGDCLTVWCIFYRPHTMCPLIVCVCVCVVCVCVRVLGHVGGCILMFVRGCTCMYAHILALYSLCTLEEYSSH